MTSPAPAGQRLRDALDHAVRGVSAPDVVFAALHEGHREVVTGGTAPPPAPGRRVLRFELGSASKTFTALLLAQLTAHGEVGYDDPVVDHLPPIAHRPSARRITLRHLATHTAGLPRLPASFYPHAVPRWATNAYAGYSADRLLTAFARTRPRDIGAWRYSNFGYAVLGLGLAHAQATGFDDLLTERVLTPLGLADTSTHPSPPPRVPRARRAHLAGTVPQLRLDGFTPAGAVRATADDLLTYLAAHLDPAGTALPESLHAVQTPLLRRDPQEAHSLGWFIHHDDRGALYFHAGATFGHTAFLGFRPAIATAVVALASRRAHWRFPLIPVAYRLLTDLPTCSPERAERRPG